MAQSSEYPDLKWMPPNAFGGGRDGKAVRYIVIHYTAGAERNTSAEDGAVYDQNRDDGTSTHYFIDSNSVVQCVLTKDRGNAARHKGNRLGIQYELCGTVQTRAQWLDAASLPTLRNAARQVARDCRKYGIPVRRLSVAETRRAWDDFPAGPKGIVGHVDCTYAYPEDGGDHTDPGPQFPWDVFLDLVREEMEGDMPLSDDDIKKLVKAFWSFDPGDNKTGAANGGVPNPDWDPKAPQPNATFAPPYALGRAVIGAKVAYQVRDRVDSLAIMLGKVLQNVSADDSELQAIQAAIDEAHEDTVRDVLAGLGAGQTVKQAVEMLVQIYGPERAVEIAAEIDEQLRTPEV